MSDQAPAKKARKFAVRQSMTYAGSTFVTMGLIDVVAHMGVTGLLVGGLASYVAWRHGGEVYEQVRGMLSSESEDRNQKSEAENQTSDFRLQTSEQKRSFLDRALGRYPSITEQSPVQVDELAADDIDALFKSQQDAGEVTGIARLTPGDIINHTPPENYQVCIGRSLTKRGNPPIFINFYGQHLKLIGASQYGKSSMAAAILYLISRTHSPDTVLMALLDMENKTSKLFADLPHLAEITVNGRPVVLHARNRREVLEYLRYIVEVMDERYTLREAEIEREPILLVYLEEFLALKDYFKRLVDAMQGEAKEQAKKNYAQLVYYVSEIARRGLKVKVQLLMCAQVDYRDEDFQEALINITGGMSFCVRVTAAAAAGFTRADLLKRNVEEDKRAQAVVETPDCKDLVLAPEFDLKQKLLAFEKSQQAGRPLLREQRTSFLTPRGTQAQEPEPVLPEMPKLEDLPRTNPNHLRLTGLHRQALEHYKPGIGYRPLGELIGVGKDKAGELLRDLKKWGYIEDEPAE